MAYTEKYCDPVNGNNLWAGSSTSTSPYTKTAGDWVQSTRVYTVKDGTNPSLSVSVGDFASVYPDGATGAAVYLGRVSAVQNLTNGTITIDGAVNAGSAPLNGTANRTIVVGGVWKGPNAASGFPFTLVPAIAILKNTNNDQVRVNMKNNASYSVTSVFALNPSGSPFVTQGYGSAVGDGGKATWDGGTSTGALINDVGAVGMLFYDMIFTTSITSGTSDLVVTTRTSYWVRCVFKGARNRGIMTTTGSCLLECEFYDCNKANTANIPAVTLNGSSMFRTIVHDNTGSAADGVVIASGPAVVQNCVIETNGRRGISVAGASFNGLIQINNTDFYNNGADAINNGSTQPNPLWIENCNFIKNTGAGINNTNVNCGGFVYNCGYGAGTQANGSSDTLGNLTKIGTVTYASNVTPWGDPANGDFRITLAAAGSAGRGTFTETQGYSSPNTVSYPDIGAAQAVGGPVGGLNLSITTMRDGYKNYAYYTLAEYLADFTITILSGSLPTGVSLSQPTTKSFLLSGTPTTPGSYSAVMQTIGVGGGIGTFTWNLTVYDDPDQGSGVVGGG